MARNPEDSFMDKVNALATRDNVGPAPAKRKSAIQRKAERLIAEDGPWEMSGPEGGDGVDTTVLVSNCDADGYDVIEITEGTLRQRKSIADQIARLLNRGKAKLL